MKSNVKFSRYKLDMSWFPKPRPTAAQMRNENEKRWAETMAARRAEINGIPPTQVSTPLTQPLPVPQPLSFMNRAKGFATATATSAKLAAGTAASKLQAGLTTLSGPRQFRAGSAGSVTASAPTRKQNGGRRKKTMNMRKKKTSKKTHR